MKENVLPLSSKSELRGENLVVEYLKDEKGYSNVKINTLDSGATEIEAVGTKTRLLVQVNTAMQPQEPSRLTSDEEDGIKSRALALSAEAWEARVTLTSRLEPANHIQWRRLV